jgi:hypothetical protein
MCHSVLLLIIDSPETKRQQLYMPLTIKIIYRLFQLICFTALEGVPIYLRTNKKLLNISVANLLTS